VKILIVERQESRASLARQLLAEYHADFKWSHTASDAELRAIAEEFKPILVFCADRMPLASRSGALDLLRLLTLRTAEIMVVDVGEAPALRLGPVNDIDTVPAPALGVEANTATWRGSLPSLFETSWDAVTLSDAAGWITCANTNACQILGESNSKALGTILDPRYFSRPDHRLHRIGYFDADGYPTPVHLTDLVARICTRTCGTHTALPVAALHLPGLRVLTDALANGAADVMLGIVDAELRAGSVGCGMVARLGDDDHCGFTRPHAPFGCGDSCAGGAARHGSSQRTPHP
jgi:hypothetical protein